MPVQSKAPKATIPRETPRVSPREAQRHREPAVVDVRQSAIDRPRFGHRPPCQESAANTGTMVRLMTIDTSTAIDSDQLKEAKN